MSNTTLTESEKFFSRTTDLKKKINLKLGTQIFWGQKFRFFKRVTCSFVVTGKHIGYIYKTVSLESHGKYQPKLASSVKWDSACTNKALCFFFKEKYYGHFFATSMHPRNATTQKGTTRYFKPAIISTISILYSGHRFVNKISFPRFLYLNYFCDGCINHKA